MKIVIFLLSLIISNLVWANKAACYAIHDPDRKNVCLAMSSRQNAYCYSVKDADTKNRKLSGLFGFQVHVGPPMKVMFKNILLKKG